MGAQVGGTLKESITSKDQPGSIIRKIKFRIEENCPLPYNIADWGKREREKKKNTCKQKKKERKTRAYSGGTGCRI